MNDDGMAANDDDDDDNYDALREKKRGYIFFIEMVFVC